MLLSLLLVGYNYCLPQVDNNYIQLILPPNDRMLGLFACDDGMSSLRGRWQDFKTGYNFKWEHIVTYWHTLISAKYGIQLSFCSFKYWLHALGLGIKTQSCHPHCWESRIMDSCTFSIGYCPWLLAIVPAFFDVVQPLSNLLQSTTGWPLSTVMIKFSTSTEKCKVKTSDERKHFTIQYNKAICIAHSGRLFSRIWGAGSRRAGKGRLYVADS